MSQEVFDVQVTEGQNLPDDSVWITNSALCGTLSWQASSDAGWLAPDPINGQVVAGNTPGSKMMLKYNTSTLSPAIYVAHVTVIADKKTPGAVVTVTLHVSPLPPTACVSGTIQDTNHNTIAGATVELYLSYPFIDFPIEATTSASDGSYELCLPPEKPAAFYVRAHKPGYYPAYTGTGLPATDVILTLLPNGGTVRPTYQWVDLFCKFNALFDGVPVPPGSVIEAFDPQGVLCGQWNVTQHGTFGFMPVYRDDQYTPAIDEGCDPGDLIRVKVDGHLVASVADPIHWGENGDRYEYCFDTPPPIPTCIVLKQGWNLVSWNLDTPNDSIMILAKDVMNNVDVILGFEQGGLTYDPMLPQFSSLLYVDHLHGFWFRMNAEDTLCVDGPMVAASTPINLEKNWNLVSYLPTVPYCGSGRVEFHLEQGHCRAWLRSSGTDLRSGISAVGYFAGNEQVVRLLDQDHRRGDIDLSRTGPDLR